MNGTIGSSSGSVATGADVSGLTPGLSPFSYGVDATSETIYGYEVNSSSGALTSEGSFSPALSAGQTLSEVAPFKPLLYSSAPVALFVHTSNNSGGAVAILVYPVGSNGMPSASATPLDTISTPGEIAESYVVLQNGQVYTFAF